MLLRRAMNVKFARNYIGYGTLFWKGLFSTLHIDLKVELNFWDQYSDMSKVSPKCIWWALHHCGGIHRCTTVLSSAGRWGISYSVAWNSGPESCSIVICLWEPNIQMNWSNLKQRHLRGPTDVEDDRPPHPKMARAVSASGLYASIVTFHALKCWLFACKLTYKVHMNSCECCIDGD